MLLSPPRNVPRAEPEETWRKYQTMKAADPKTPVFLTLTGHFHPFFKNWSKAQRLSCLLTENGRTDRILDRPLSP